MTKNNALAADIARELHSAPDTESESDASICAQIRSTIEELEAGNDALIPAWMSRAECIADLKNQLARMLARL